MTHVVLGHCCKGCLVRAGVPAELRRHSMVTGWDEETGCTRRHRPGPSPLPVSAAPTPQRPKTGVEN